MGGLYLFALPSWLGVWRRPETKVSGYGLPGRPVPTMRRGEAKIKPRSSILSGGAARKLKFRATACQVGLRRPAVQKPGISAERFMP